MGIKIPSPAGAGQFCGIDFRVQSPGHGQEEIRVVTVPIGNSAAGPWTLTEQQRRKEREGHHQPTGHLCTTEKGQPFPQWAQCLLALALLTPSQALPNNLWQLWMDSLSSDVGPSATSRGKTDPAREQGFKGRWIAWWENDSLLNSSSTLPVTSGESLHLVPAWLCYLSLFHRDSP